MQRFACVLRFWGARLAWEHRHSIGARKFVRPLVSGMQSQLNDVKRYFGADIQRMMQEFEAGEVKTHSPGTSWTSDFHLVKLFSPVGFEGNLSLLDIFFILSRRRKQMEAEWEMGPPPNNMVVFMLASL